MKVTCDKKPDVFITMSAKEKLDCYLRLCDEEISGLGTVLRQNGLFVINDVLLFKQEVTAGSTDLDEETISKFIIQSVMDGHDVENLKMWWHSHVNGGCFWSSTDNDTANKFNNEWMISIVGNKKGEYKVRIDLYSPVRVTVDEIDLQVYYPVSKEMTEKIKAEIEEKVKKKEFDFSGILGPYQKKQNDAVDRWRQMSLYGFDDWEERSWTAENYRQWNKRMSIDRTGRDTENGRHVIDSQFPEDDVFDMVFTEDSDKEPFHEAVIDEILKTKSKAEKDFPKKPQAVKRIPAGKKAKEAKSA